MSVVFDHTLAVPPEREPYLQEFPQSSLYTIPRGASVNWTVVLVAGSYDDVLWLFGDSPAEIVDTPPDCVNQTDINFFATVTEGYVVNYTRQFWTTVHICNARVNNTGIYSLVVQSWKAKRHTVVSFQVDVEGEVTCSLFLYLKYRCLISSNKMCVFKNCFSIRRSQ